MPDLNPPAPVEKSAEELKTELEAATKRAEDEARGRIEAEAKAKTEADARARAEAAIVSEKNKLDAFKRSNTVFNEEVDPTEIAEAAAKKAVDTYKQELAQGTISEIAAELFPDDATRIQVLERYEKMPKSGLTPGAIKKDLDDIAFLLNRTQIEAQMQEAKNGYTPSGGTGGMNGAPPANTGAGDRLSASEEKKIAEIAAWARVAPETARATFIKNKREMQNA